MKKNITIFMLVFLCFSSPARSDFVANFKITMTQGTSHPYALGALKFGELLEQRTQGRLKVTLFPNSKLGQGERQMLELLRFGKMDIYIGSTGPVGLFCPPMLMVNAPFFFRDNEHVDAILDGAIGKALLRELDKAGFKGLAFWENGFRHLSNNSAPGRTPQELANLSVRVMENQIHLLAFQAAGMNPVPMPFSKLYAALEQGVLNGQENPIAVFYDAKFNKIQKYLTLTKHFYSPALFLFDLKRWNRIPKADQEIIAKTAQEVAIWERKINREEEEAKLAEMEANGLIVVRDVDHGTWQKAMQPAFDRAIKQLSKEQLTTIMNSQ